MVVEPITHIRRDERGVAWIAETNTKVIEVAMDRVAYGWDAEEIHAAHPHLSLAQIHAALSFYHDHKGEIDVQMPRPITRGLRRHGVDVLTAQEDGTTRWEDAELLDRAAALNRILFSQ